MFAFNPSCTGKHEPVCILGALFLEGPYADVIRTSICILAGVPPPMLFVIMFVDGTWGAFIHIGESVMKKADLGVVGKYILTPSHHRVHHAKNIEYMDTNFCNLLNIWDKVFKTYQPQNHEVKIEYGITRAMKPNSFLDAYFGEIPALAKDVYRAPGIKNKILYLFMPPGWSHTGNHKTAAAMKKSLSKYCNTRTGAGVTSGDGMRLYFLATSAH